MGVKKQYTPCLSELTIVMTKLKENGDISDIDAGYIADELHKENGAI